MARRARKRRLKRRHVPLILLPPVAIAVAVSLSSLTGGPPATITIRLGGPHGTPTTTVKVPQAAVEQAADATGERSLRTENPPGLTPAQLDDAREQQERLAASSALPNVTPFAAPQQRGCVTRLVQNYSSRRGVPPRAFVFHWTGSANRPGPSDVLAIAALFDRPSFQASSNYVVDAEGNCLYLVRESDKAWTQAAANPFSISVEVVNTGGGEKSYAGVAGFKKLVLILRDAARRWKIPLQLASVRGCLVARAGVADHQALGPCGGGHPAIGRYSVPALIAAAKALDGKPKPPPLRACTLRNLQRKLGLAPDGELGPETRAAIRRFQRRHGLRPTGHAGKRVGALLRLRGCRV